MTCGWSTRMLAGPGSLRNNMICCVSTQYVDCRESGRFALSKDRSLGHVSWVTTRHAAVAMPYRVCHTRCALMSW
jgi:hypothetical protein